MTWALSLLLNNQHALKKLKDELDEHVGRERLVTESDIGKLVYLQAVVKETLRLYAAGPLSGPREFINDCTLGGYHIKADPRVRSDAFEFQPERFLTTYKDVDVKGQHFELRPFGGGRRSCRGTSFALQMTHYALATFLQAFEVTAPNNTQCFKDEDVIVDEKKIMKNTLTGVREEANDFSSVPNTPLEGRHSSEANNP
ncbi:hypothetical protein Fmac_000362 [Flemingia macrophylla]|uniref:Cytochrome P450 n=1 Tax=Flemingia macrophylla TaxID=520843 RepID=A0ABD1NE16_9FABA